MREREERERAKEKINKGNKKSNLSYIRYKIAYCSKIEYNIDLC